MCGLVGAFKADGAHYKNVGAFVEQGLYMSALRGMGGTGLGIVNKDFEAIVSKSYVSSPVFIQTQEYEEATRDLTSARAILGHTRFATVSNSTSSKNAHPFHFHDDQNAIMLTHNGHIQNYHALTPNGFNHQVDSAHVAYGMLKKGINPTLEELKGFYALVFYDAATETVNIARNDHREFSYVFSKDKKVIYYASEAVMLYLLVQRTGIDIHESGYLEVPAFTKMSWDLNEKSLENPTVEKYEEKKYLPAAPRNTGVGHGGYTSNYGVAPKKGDSIWVAVGDPDTDFQFYNRKPTDEGVDQSTIFGSMMGIRRMDSGYVKIQGINWNEWKEKWTLLKDGDLQVEIDEIDTTWKHPTTGVVRNYYTGHLNRTACESEYFKKKARSAELEARIKAYRGAQGGDDATARALPAPSGDAGAVRKDDAPAQGGGSGAVPGSGDAELEVVSSPYTFTPVYVQGPKKRMILLKEWKEIAAQGCFFSCDNSRIVLADVGKVAWYPLPRNPEDPEDQTEYQMICPLCVQDKQLMHSAGLE
jgi:predicted glutamine amidotransferase